MTDLALAPSRFSSRRSLSPGALGAAIAVHVGVAAVIIALPPELIPIERITRLIVTNVPVPPEPTPVDPPKPDPKVEAVHTRQPIPDRRPAAEDTVLDSQGPLIGGDPIGIDPPTLPKTDPGEALDPPRVPVIVGARADPRYADAFQPAYPPAMLRLGREGSCTVRVTIDTQGRVASAVAVGGSDPAFCAATQRQALTKWRFRAATRDGTAIAAEKEMTVHFRMQD